MTVLSQCTLTVPLYSFSQIPGLRSGNRKAKSTIHSAAKEARIPAAKRIGAQLASHISKGSVTHSSGDPMMIPLML